MTQHIELPVIDEHGDDFLADPFAVTRAAREQHWMARTSLGMMTLTYEGARQIFRDERYVQPHLPMLKQMGITDGIILEVNENSLVTADGDPHTRLKRLVTKAFTPRRIETLRPLMRSVIHDRLDAVVETGRCEFVSDIAELYPLRIICAMLGIPESDQAMFVGFLAEQVKVLNWNLEEDRPGIEAAMHEMKAYLLDLLDRRRADPGDDLLTDLLDVRDDSGDALTIEEVIWMVDTLLVGGLDTTRCQLGHAMVLFSDHPDDWSRLASDADLIGPAVEEVIRYRPTVLAQPKVATQDIEYEDLVVPAGTPVFVSIGAANRDPAVFENPDTFNIDREPHTNLGFGAAAHYCIGASLARLEMVEALPILARRMPSMTVDGPIEWRPLVGITGPDHLPLRFDPQTS